MKRMLVRILLVWSGSTFVGQVDLMVVLNLSTLMAFGQALLNFRTAVVSSDGILTHWRPEDPDPCNWKGVECDKNTKRVITLSLTNHKLSGPIAPDLGKLDQLKFLTLHNNNFYGEIPSELGNCTELQAV
ncbi:hypothetical protein Patl1_02598 [Pistacia atlantica]|uniref:Uncharacterized protein n=1 Tax=Pistacia atlantica TaxID=434234 RepID=A0ACC1C5P8_9ROSI|nr:hypothetical protein Patl1_02598 [Pistacia atlantica]